MAVVSAEDTDDTSLSTASKGLSDIQHPDLIVVAVGAGSSYVRTMMTYHQQSAPNHGHYR
jgi:hypothetical protein